VPYWIEQCFTSPPTQYRTKVIWETVFTGQKTQPTASKYWRNKYSVQKSDPLNVWLWQVQTCTTLHIILRAQALMYSDYWHHILYKSVVPFSRFSIFTKHCQKVQLPAALLARFLCAVTVFYVNVQHFSFNAICWYFISWTYQADYYWSSCEGKWVVLLVDYAIWDIVQERVYRYQIGDVDHMKERLIYELCHFDQPIIDRAVVQ